MITDEERREVAQKLREPKESLLAYPADELIRLRHETGCPRGQDFYEHLADLIDRPTCNDVSDFDHESFKCSRCGYRVLSIDGSSETAKLVAPEGGVIDFGYCPNCGAEVVEE